MVITLYKNVSSYFASRSAIAFRMTLSRANRASILAVSFGGNMVFVSMSIKDNSFR